MNPAAAIAAPAAVITPLALFICFVASSRRLEDERQFFVRH